MYPDLDPQLPYARLLRELPGEVARPYGFAEFEQRTRERARNERRALPVRTFLAVVVAAGVLAFTLRFSASPPGGRARSPVIDAASPGWLPAGAPASVASEVMEQWLATLPREPAVVHVGTRAAVTGLEDRIAQVDDLLSVARVEQPTRLAALQQERTRLVGTLLQVRYAETLVDESR